MKTLIIALLAISLLLVNCSKDENNIDPDNLLIGVWNYSDFNDTVYSYVRSQDFIDNYGYKFNRDGTMIERRNSGWCGTPPIAYADYPGNWTLINDTLIQINVGYWGGSMSYKIKIKYLDSTSLKAVYVYEGN